MNKKRRRWQELQRVGEMSKDQFGFFQTKLDQELRTQPLAEFATRLTAAEPRPRKNELIDQLNALRCRSYRPSPNTKRFYQIDRRLQPLLGHLKIADPPDDIFLGRVYLVVEDGCIKYVGSGGTDRVSRFSGLLLPTFEPHENLCLTCLEALTLWIARTLWHTVESSRRSPALCETCRNDFLPKLLPALKHQIGSQLSSYEILRLLELISRREDRQL